MASISLWGRNLDFCHKQFLDHSPAPTLGCTGSEDIFDATCASTIIDTSNAAVASSPASS